VSSGSASSSGAGPASSGATEAAPAGVGPASSGATSSGRTSAITTHVLDTARGRPAAGVAVRLELVPGDGQPLGQPPLGQSVTDADGRVRDLGPAVLPAGIYRLVFGTGAYFAGQGGDPAFFPEIAVTFRVDGQSRHHHVPLLLSPFAYSTYRGS
jgi:5-hydroxyisourate hydrolase